MSERPKRRRSHLTVRNMNRIYNIPIHVIEYIIERYNIPRVNERNRFYYIEDVLKYLPEIEGRNLETEACDHLLGKTQLSENNLATLFDVSLEDIQYVVRHYCLTAETKSFYNVQHVGAGLALAEIPHKKHPVVEIGAGVMARIEYIRRFGRKPEWYEAERVPAHIRYNAVFQWCELLAEIRSVYKDLPYELRA